MGTSREGEPGWPGKRQWERYLQLVDERPECFKQPDAQDGEGALEIILDETAVRQFSKRSGTTIGVVYESPYSILVVDLVRDARGSLFSYERLLPAVRTGAVVAIPRIDGRYVLLRQFRHATRGLQLAFPRGFGERGISGASNARKELLEEIGATVGETRSLGRIVANSGISGDSVEVFLCEVSKIDPTIGHEGIAGIVLLTEDEVRAAISSGRIDDGFTLGAWSLLSSNPSSAGAVVS